MDEQSIKAASKQFDLSCVFKLNMPRMHLKRIENLSLVPSLTELDLSCNKISRMEGLDGLESLKRLVLSSNEIERIEGLESQSGARLSLTRHDRRWRVNETRCPPRVQRVDFGWTRHHRRRNHPTIRQTVQSLQRPPVRHHRQKQATHQAHRQHLATEQTRAARSSRPHPAIPAWEQEVGRTLEASAQRPGHHVRCPPAAEDS